VFYQNICSALFGFVIKDGRVGQTERQTDRRTDRITTANIALE